MLGSNSVSSVEFGERGVVYGLDCRVVGVKKEPRRSLMWHTYEVW